MIRYIVGALFKVLQGKISLDDLGNYLQYHQEDKLSAKAKSKGLHLIRIQEQTMTKE
jgi:tRNA pseudouridine38-40 synthase